ncbi:hypothetical protein [Dapis sp. BLCC M229]|uniref:hypothetical protein n=1 Tax=Dapis sp. BLCC M229 TaxID=3400188 RepID=UPI003CECF94E
MILLNELSEHLQIEDPEERHTISPVSWSQYETLLSTLGDRSSYRISYLDYLDGVLEIVAPSRRHKSGKTRIGTLARNLLSGNQHRILSHRFHNFS